MCEPITSCFGIFEKGTHWLRELAQYVLHRYTVSVLWGADPGNIADPVRSKALEILLHYRGNSRPPIPLQQTMVAEHLGAGR
jgi:hypothetical protein